MEWYYIVLICLGYIILSILFCIIYKIIWCKLNNQKEYDKYTIASTDVLILFFPICFIISFIYLLYYYMDKGINYLVFKYLN